MCNFGLGIACIVNTDYQLKGIFTDGDIRRLILKVQKPIAALYVDDVIDYSTKEYTSIIPETSLKNEFNAFVISDLEDELHFLGVANTIQVIVLFSLCFQVVVEIQLQLPFHWIFYFHSVRRVSFV